jgi:hypothetical protein
MKNLLFLAAVVIINNGCRPASLQTMPDCSGITLDYYTCAAIERYYATGEFKMDNDEPFIMVTPPREEIQIVEYQIKDPNIHKASYVFEK